MSNLQPRIPDDMADAMCEILRPHAPPPPHVPNNGPGFVPVLYTRSVGILAVDAATRLADIMDSVGWWAAPLNPRVDPDEYGPAEGLQLVLYTLPTSPPYAGGELGVKQEALQSALALLKEPVQVFTSPMDASNTGIAYIVVGDRPGRRARFIPRGPETNRTVPGAIW